MSSGLNFKAGDSVSIECIEPLFDRNPINFNVVRKPLFFENSNKEKVQKDAIIREDTEEVLGIVSPGYTIISHKEAVEKTERLLRSITKKVEVNKLKIENSGARIFVTYALPYWDREILPNDKILPLVTVGNSYDQSLSLRFTMGVYRVVCDNGVTVTDKVFRFSHKHTGDVERVVFGKNLYLLLTRFMQDITQKYKRMIDRVVDEKLLTRLLKVQIPKKLVKNLFEPKISYWELYNRFTAYLSHEYEGSFFYRAEIERKLHKVLVVGDV